MFDELDQIFSIQFYLDRFKTVQPSKIYNFRCNICGDSKKSEFKARGYFIFSEKDSKFFFKCHNCGVSLSFATYFSKYFPNECREWKIKHAKEILKKQPREFRSNFKESIEKYMANKVPIEPSEPVQTGIDNDLIMAVEDHPAAKEYIIKRKIPESQWFKLFATDRFGDLVHSMDSDKKYADRRLPNDSRLVFLLCDVHGNINGIQGRALDSNSKLRYAICMFNSDAGKHFGLDSVDKEKTIIATEGAIDSLFLNNAIAVNGGDATGLDYICSNYSLDKSKLIVAFDNEPRSKDTMKRLSRAIDLGYKVVIWNDLKTDCKDINEMVLSGISPEKIENYILNNNYSGIRAKLKLNSWKKV